MRLPQPELRRARIEIVPMIDTIFFLLVFFMITSLAMVKLNSKKVVLPESETASLKPTSRIFLTVDSSGKFFVNRQALQPGQVVPKLRDLVKGDPQSQIVLNCDRELPVSYFVTAYDDAKQANAAHVMIATSPRKREGG
jgi:biopolymer transport protein ExbD